MDTIVDTFKQAESSTSNWSIPAIEELFSTPFNDLLLRAQLVHRQHFNANEIQLSTLLSIKTGGCSEDCSYCPQSAHYRTGVEATALLDKATVVEAAEQAQRNGATRFCMGAAWRQLKAKDLDKILAIVTAVHRTGLETCLTVGMLTADQACRLKAAGLDYNHNIDTSEAYYSQIISTRSYQDRLRTLQGVREAGLKVCCGGIIGMGESLADRVSFLHTLASLPTPPESVPINTLVPVAGTPLQNSDCVNPIELAQTVAVARILMPKSYVRLSAGRSSLTDAEQALCFFAGANSVFYGDELLTTPNQAANEDDRLFLRLGLKPRLTHGLG